MSHSEANFTSRAVAFFSVTVKSVPERERKGKRASTTKGGKVGAGGRLRDENDPRDREFRGSGSDGRIRSCISRVETRFAQVCFSSLFACNASLLFSLRVSLSLSRLHSSSFSFTRPKQKEQLDQLGARSEGQARRRGEKKEE